MSAHDGATGEVHNNSAAPSMARMWDYYLAGTDNSKTDRQAASIVLREVPDIPLTALENRNFLKHAVRFLTEEAGVRQFIDIGSGLPTQGNIHQLAQEYTPDARIAYVDNDSVVLSHGRAHMNHFPLVRFIAGDLRRPGALLANSELRKLIDFSEPVALCMTLVLHFITDTEDPYGMVAWLRSELSPGSYIVISHMTGDDHDEDAMRQVVDSYGRNGASLVMRSRAEIEAFFAGLELIAPGVVFLSQWRPAAESRAGGGTRWAYAGIGRKNDLPGKGGTVS